MKQLGRKILLFALTVGIIASLTTPALALDNSTSTIELGNDQEFLTDVER